MSARDLATAVEQLFGALQSAVACLAPTVLAGRRYHAADAPHALSLSPETDPAPLGRTVGMGLSIRHFYRFLDPGASPPKEGSAIATVGYVYELLDHAGLRIVGYHWHPIPGGEIGYPHLHVGRQLAHPCLPEAIRAAADRLVRSHLPTGLVVLPTVVRLAIVEFGVEPLHENRREVLDETEREARRALSAG